MRRRTWSSCFFKKKEKDKKDSKRRAGHLHAIFVFEERNCRALSHKKIVKLIRFCPAFVLVKVTFANKVEQLNL